MDPTRYCHAPLNLAAMHTTPYSYIKLPIDIGLQLTNDG